MPLTKQDLASISGIVDRKVGAVDSKIDGLSKEMQTGFSEVRKEMRGEISGLRNEMHADFAVVRSDIHEIKDELNGLREQIQSLAVTLDNFLKRMTDREDEFVILKGEVDEIKRIIKDKLGVEVRVAF